MGPLARMSTCIREAETSVIGEFKMEKAELLTVSQISERLQLKRSWVYSHADSLGAYRVGKYLRFRWERVLERLESLDYQTNDLL